MDNRQLRIEYDKINKAYDDLGQTLIDSVKSTGLQLVDLYTFIQAKNKLDIRKNKLEYLIMINDLK